MTTLLTLCVLLVIYGSFYPFTYVAHAASSQELINLLLTWPNRLAIPDVVGNIALFAPIGALIPSLRKKHACISWILGSVLLAWAIQYCQYWFPDREPSAADAWFNTLGLALGLVLRWQAGTVGKTLPTPATGNPAVWQVSTFLVLAWVAYRWFPLVPTLDLQNIKNNVKPLYSPFEFDWIRILHNTTAWLIFLRLARYSLLFRLSTVQLRVLALLITAAEPFFAGNQLSHANVLGIVLGILFLPFFTQGRARLLGLVGLTLLSMCLSGLYPFELTEPRAFLWVPFAGMLEGDLVLNTASLLEKFFWYGGTIYLLGYFGLKISTASVGLAGLMLILELVQTMVPSHVPEITDPVFCMVLGFGMSMLLNPEPSKPAVAMLISAVPDNATGRLTP